MSIAALPKAELHCHLGGVLDPQMVRDLEAAGQGLGLDPQALEACYPVRSITDFVDVYSAFIDRFLTPREVRLLPLLVQQVRRRLGVGRRVPRIAPPHRPRPGRVPR